MNNDLKQKMAGLVISKLREELVLSRKDLVEKSGIPEERLSSVENGESELSLGELVSLSEGLGMSPVDVLRLIVQAVEKPDEWLESGMKRIR